MLAMIAVVERKKNYNLNVFGSVAKRFDEIVNRDHGSQKGLCATSAMLMFNNADRDKRAEIVELVARASVRTWDGDVNDVASRIIKGPAAGSKPTKSAREQQAEAAARGARRQGHGGAGQGKKKLRERDVG